MKIRLLLFLMMLGLTQVAFAGNGDLFSYDKQALEQEFAGLQQLEDYLTANPEMTLGQIQQNPAVLPVSLNLSAMQSAGPLGAMFTIDDMDWGSFAWGYCCAPVGFFVVAINDKKSSDQKLSYWIGLATATFLGTIGTITRNIVVQ
jgi:hypothetical protein